VKIRGVGLDLLGCKLYNELGGSRKLLSKGREKE